MRPLAIASLCLALAALAGCARPDHIEIEPHMPRLTRKGETLLLRGKLMDRGGRYFSGESATFTSRDPFIAAVDDNGEVAALSSGHALVRAQWNELWAEVPVEVDLVEALRVSPDALDIAVSGEPVKIAVTPLGLDGRPLRDREVQLASANPAVARVDPEGRVWGIAPGTSSVRAKIDDKESDIVVRVK